MRKEAGGTGILSAAGLALAFMSFTMFIATVMLISSGQPYAVFSHPLKMVVVFLSLILIGPGRFSLDSRLSKSGN
jgi:putative oxidoreductase